MSTITFQNLPLAEPLQRRLIEQNYQTPSPIQEQAIPQLLEGRDMMGVAQTGTGKTAAFALPILHKLHMQPKPLGKGIVRALIMTPTRELAEQVCDSFKNYGRYIDFTCTKVHGGVSQTPQTKALRKGVDVLVATPGRLLDLFSQGHIQFKNIEFLVLDEADRMLDMGFLPDIRRVIDELPAERQSLFFSATLSPQIIRLAQGILIKPVEIRIAPEKSTAENVDHRICFLAKNNKFDLLSNILKDQKGKDGKNLTIIFSRTKHGANRLATDLGRSGLRAEAIHGNKTQAARQRALDNFKTGRSNILVATDVASRGIDVRDITLVVNYDLPNEPEAYIHRIGRTARAGSSGNALSFCCSETRGELSAIEKLLRMKIPVHSEHPYHEEKLVIAQQKAPGKNKGKPAWFKGRSGNTGFMAKRKRNSQRSGSGKRG
jgi:ATP-dependent RNA helicase RhlE